MESRVRDFYRGESKTIIFEVDSLVFDGGSALLVLSKAWAKQEIVLEKDGNVAVNPEDSNSNIVTFIITKDDTLGIEKGRYKCVFTLSSSSGNIVKVIPPATYPPWIIACKEK